MVWLSPAILTHFIAIYIAKPWILSIAFITFLSIFPQNNSLAQVTSDFSAHVTQGCNPLVVCFDNHSTGAIDFLWDFGNGNMSTDNEPCIIYMNPGIYTVSLTASFGSDSDTKTMTAMITVFAFPVVDFSTNNDIVCANESVTFMDMTVLGDAPIVSWTWDFGDGNSSGEQNPSHFYSDPDVYPITLIVRDAYGCSDGYTITSMVTVLPSPTASFTATPSSSCSFPTTVTFQDQSTGSGITGYSWDFGDGNTSTQQNPIHNYTTPGNYTVTLTVTGSNGCSSTDTLTNFLGSGSMNADFSVSDTVGCGSVSANFTDQSTSSGMIVNWAWDFGDGGASTSQNPSHNYTVPGTYDVTLTVTDNNGCSDDIVYEDLITVYARPIADFTANQTQGCTLPFAVDFTETASGEVSYLWEFGDGATSASQNSSHVYASSGSYGVRLTVTSANGCTAISLKPNYINATNPTADFTTVISAGCLDVTVTFSDQSNSASPITNWSWAFGDGGTSIQQNPSHDYTASGNYNVMLVIINAEGCTDTVVKPINIALGSGPVADFTVNNNTACITETITFSDASVSANSIVSWQWNFGDGGTSTSPNPTYEYTIPGIYDVTLMVTDSNGCTDSIAYENLITIYTNPAADFTADQTQGCALPFNVIFTETATEEVSWFWEFGDGTTSALQHPSHTYSSSGSYGVRLTVTSDDGCTATSFKPNYINATSPTADFTTAISAGCLDVTVNFSDQSNSASPVTSWFWAFGDGGTSIQQNPSHDYTTSGTYNVMLVIINVEACMDTVVKPINIALDSGPVADFTVNNSTVCISETINFSDASVSANTMVSWQWDFGDGGTSMLQNPSHNYTIPGTYDVTLTVTDNSGCSDDIIHQNVITVNPTPAADFTADQTPGCALPVTVNFTETSVDDISNSWDFGDGNTSVLQNPSHDYASPGTYNVMQVVTNALGCRDTIIKPINIMVSGNLVADFTTSDNGVCINETINFSDASVSDGTIISWAWDFGDGNTSTLQNPAHAYNVPGTYDVTLTVSDNNGCTDIIVYEDLITVAASPVSDFTANDVPGCSLPITLNFTEVATNDVSWFWEFGDSNTSTLQNPSHNYTVVGSYNVMLVAANAGGCKDTITKPINIAVGAGPVANFTMNDNDVCIPETISFSDGSVFGSAIVSWEWNFGDGNTSAQQNPFHAYITVDIFTVTLMIETNTGCRDTVSKIVVTNGPSIADAGPDQIICIGDTAILTASGGLVYSWTSPASLSDTHISNPSAFPTNTTTYTLTVFDSLGCTDTDNVTVTVHPLPILSATPAAICIGDSAQLSASGGVSYSWAPASTLSNPNISNPIANPDSTTSYTITVTDPNGCVNSVNTILVVHELPIVTISVSNTSICNGQSAQLNAGGGINYSWSPTSWLNDPNIPNPVSTPPGSIIYAVTVIDSNGCENRDTVGITVQPMPGYFVSPDTSICKGDTVSLSASGGTTINWNPASELSCTICNNPNAYPETTSTYYVEITDTGGCMVTDSVEVTVFSAQTITVTNDTFICTGGSVQLSATGGINYEWFPATGLDNAFVSSPVASPDSSTTYTVRVVSAAGCTTDDSVFVEVKDINADMTLPASTGCTPANMQFADHSSSSDPIISWQWDFGDGNTSNQQNPVHSYVASGSFMVSLTVTSSAGCTGTKQLTDYFGSGSLDADFSVDQTPGCEIVSSNFTDLSTSSGSIVSWQWDFGDGGSSTLQNPSHNYTIIGTYDVTLTITDSSGCTDVIAYEDFITVPVGPSADFDNDQTQGCSLSLTVNFTESATSDVSWFWEFGDGNNSSLQNPSHNYSMTGTYNVMLVVASAEGCTDSIIKPITISIGSGPAADFTMDDNDVCIPETINFLDVSVADSIISWEWNFGDGNSSVLQNPTHTYTAVDTFDVILMIETIAGCRDTLSKTVVTNGPSIADAGADQVICLGDTATLTGSGGLVFFWSSAESLSDPNVSNPSAFPTTTTTYTLTVYDSLGCSDTDDVTVTVYPLPVLSLSKAAICIGDSIQLIVSGGVNYSWSPASTLSNPNISNPIANPDSTTTYTVIVTDVNGCVNSINTTLTVHPLPSPLISAANQFPCEGQPVQLNAAGGVNYSWSPPAWLDSPNIPNPVSTPHGSLTYTVTVIDHNGCKNEDSISISISSQLAYTIGPDTSICKGDTVQLSANGGTSITWYPATGLSCTTCNNPNAYPDSTTTYYVEIIDTGGCTVTDSVKVTVFSTQTIDISTDTFICKGGSVPLNASGGVDYVWSPATRLDNAFVPFPIASPDTSTTYTVRVISPFGCSANGSVHIEVLDFNADMSLSENSGCLPVDVQFTGFSSSDDSIISWLWDFDNGRFSNDQNPFEVFGTPGTYDVNLTVTTAGGCVDSIQESVIVYALPTVVAGPDTAVCGGSSVQLYGSGGQYYNWSPSVGLNAINVPNPIAAPNVTRYYELIVTDANGCIGIDSVLITVNDLPVTTISEGVALCYGDSTQLEVTGGNSYSWTPVLGLSNPNVSNPIAHPEITTVYVVRAETGLGCDAVDSVTVVVYPKPSIVVKAEDEICKGDSTQFNVSGAVNYEWSPATALSCVTCSDPVAKPQTSITYVLKMTDAYNCIWHDTIPLIVNPLPEVHTTNDKAICKGEDVELTSQHTGATAFEWIPPFGLSSYNILSPIASPQQTTEYVIIARNEFACDDRDSVVINVIDHIHASVSDNQRICNGSSISLEARIDQSGSNAASVIWMPESAFEDPTAFTQIVAPSISTTYSVIAQGDQCVPDTQYVHVHVDESPDVDAGEDRIVMAGTEVLFTATSNYNITSYYWSPSSEMSCFDCQTTTVIASESGTYYVNVTDANGCPAVDSVEVRVIETCDGDIWMPNAFTPNGDEVNDNFRVRSTGFIELVSFRVVDRWGSIVFETTDINEGWDGKYKGEFVNTDVYVWWIRATCSDGLEVEKKGNVTIIR